MWTDRLLDQVFPKFCLLCGARGHAHIALCAGCLSDLPRLGACCERCALPLPHPGLCGRCQRHPPSYVRVRSAYRYEPPLDALLLQLKFSSRLAVAPLLGTLLARALVPVHSDSLLVPVPLHRRRLAERGFNQVAEVARAVARELGLERSTVALKRTRYTPPQSSVNAHARRQLLRGVFAAEEHRVADRRIVLIDDVVTTGATAEAASEALYAAGARTVEVWTVARTPEPSGHSQ